ncbi:MAG: tripartite tricarboxylate transporter substrate binding protein [Pseudomonadota bacterium]
MRLNRISLLMATAVLLTVSSAQAQNSAAEYPNKPVKIVLGFVAGGGPDFVARALAQKLTELMGQPFVVENRPGAGGTMAGGQVAKAPADGYTLMMGETGPVSIAPHVYKNVPYNPLTDFTPVAMLTSEPVFIVSSAKSNIKTLPDLIREAKANPGKIAYGSSGVGTIHHIVAEAFKAGAGIDLMHVPYKGSGQSVPAALAGDVPVLITAFNGAGAHIKAGTMHLLAVTTAERSPLYPNAPAVTEFVKGYDFTSQTGLFAPPNLPAPILAKLTAAVKKATESPEFTSRFKDSSTLVTYKNPVEYAELLKINLKKYGDAVKLANIQPE